MSLFRFPPFPLPHFPTMELPFLNLRIPFHSDCATGLTITTTLQWVAVRWGAQTAVFLESTRMRNKNRVHDFDHGTAWHLF